GDLGREPIYQELRRCAEPSNTRSHPSGWKRLNESDTPRQAATLGCTPVSGRDNPHRSSTGVAASGHGWWEKGNCSNDRAKVFNCLYEWYTDNTCRQQACSETKTLKPGGGSTQHTTARRDCRDTQRTSWRNHGDVDVIGEIDSGEKPMNQAEMDCRVY
ncbi:hypothetical protein, partial [Streptomyces sp. NPDC056361]|uniref:hypothetical protein n=1 Tax=Streptomyces sp. NPDC056361 TaxID=3345795 RepID=UPI0035E2A975